MGSRGGTEEVAGDGFMRGFVLDTSVILKWFSPSGESDLDSALQLRQSMVEGTVFFVVPDLLFYELANALRHNPNFSKKDVEQAVCSVLEMRLEVRSLNEEVMREAISLAFKHDVTVYDAYFLALSKKEDKPFITADYRFMGRVKGFREIIKLSDFS
jgi:predicted nucleic acid-binding protein